MGEHRASGAPNKNKEEDAKTSSESEESSEELTEETIEEFSEDSVSRSPLDSDNDCTEQAGRESDEEPGQEASDESASQPSSESGNHDTKQPIEGPREELENGPTETLEESLSRPSPDNGNDNNEQSIEELSEESEEDPDEEPFEESVSQPSLDADTNDIADQSESLLVNSNKKKRSLDATVGDSGPSQQPFRLPKKCKPESSLEPESDAGSAVTDPQNKYIASKFFISAGNASEQQEHTGSSGKRKRSRWGPQPEGNAEEGDRDRKMRKTRWTADDSQLKMLGPIQLPDFVKELVGTNLDPEILELKMKLVEMNKKLLGAEVHDDRPEEERSPSPPPVYDNLGVRVNSRDVRFRDKLIRDRQNIISRLIQKNPTFKPPSDYKPPKLYKKLYIPLKEYPGYNFVGLIIGPRGNTQKKMEKETGAKILLRGKGSVKERKSQQKPDPSDNEDLHVLIEADNQKSLDAAVGMVEKLLIPVAEGMNEHKRSQLRELAKLNGVLRDENLCKTCGEEGHKNHTCPRRDSTFNVGFSCDVCGRNHPTSNCPLTASTPGSNCGNQYHSFLADLGGVTFGTSPISSSKPWGGSSTGFGTPPSYGSYSCPGLGSTPTTDGKSNKKVDDSNLFVGYLPQIVDDNRLTELFSPFGRLIEAKVIKDRSTGFSKGYGFVKYDNPISAATAVAHMNGYKIDGKMLIVRVAGRPQMSGSSGISLLPKYPGNAVVSQDSLGQAAWPGPPGSLLAEPQSSSIKSDDFGLPPLSVFLGHDDSSSKQLLPSFESPHNIPILSPSSLAQFPGNMIFPGSEFQSYFTTPVSNSYLQTHLTTTLGHNLTPFTPLPTHTLKRGTKNIEFEYEKFMPGIL